MTDKIRLLAAIMFTDMVGYTALMQENEEKAKSKRTLYKEILEDKINEFQGKLLQYYGDGGLVIFGSAITAVQCAVKAQNLLIEKEVPVRIGLHIGDVVYDNEGVFGDAVNIASRIESLGVPGSVILSEKLYDEIKNHPELSVKQMGHFELKNVKIPVAIYAMTCEGLVIPRAEELKGKAKNAYRSVAVLPFMNISSDPENEFFSDGITEEIINALSKVDGLYVTARTSSFAFKGKHDDIRTIGQKLNVSTILEGSVRKAGEKVRITAQLINAVNGYHFWSESYDGKLENIFELQDEISRKIANKLIAHLAVGKVTAPLIKSASVNAEAYNHYLKGIYYWNKWTPKDTIKGIEELNKAIESEPEFAKAFAWLANCYTLSGVLGFQKPAVVNPIAKKNALKAMELDTENPDCMMAMGLVYLFIDWNWDEAGKLLEKLILLSPGRSNAHHAYGTYLAIVGKESESLAEMEKSVMLDPLNLPTAFSLANCYFASGRYDDCITQLNKILELEPNFRKAMEMKGFVYFAKGDYDTAISFLREIHNVKGAVDKTIAGLGYVYSRCGCSDKSYEILELMKKAELSEPDSSFSLDFAFIYAGLRDYDKAFEYLEKAVDERLGAVLFLRSSLVWKELKNDPRFSRILDKIGLPV